MLSILYNIPDSPWPDWGGWWIVLSVYCEIWPRGQEMVWPLQARDSVGSSSQKVSVSFPLNTLHRWALKAVLIRYIIFALYMAQ